MNCANHPEAPVSAYCRSCGKPLCTECRHEVNGTVFCSEHTVAGADPVSQSAASSTGSASSSNASSTTSSSVPPPPPNSSPYASPYTSPYGAAPPSGPYSASARSGVSPGLAFILGFIPGVGAIYNGQYAKGLVHAVVFGLFVSMLSSGRLHDWEPLFGILLSIWIFYMAFEAYHTARKRRDGEPVEELSSLMQVPGGGGRVPVGPIVLIGLGVLFLLDTLHLLAFDEIVRFWPVGLIIGGGYMLYARMDSRARGESGARVDPSERGIR
jgi:Domain of unknown function (DUF5668)/B-box zinc finger